MTEIGRLAFIYREIFRCLLYDKRSLYWFFALLRLLFNFFPQTGYIHPDEFFQYIEVAAGDSFDIDVYKPWEYNVTFPIRSSIFPQLCVRLPYLLLECLDPKVEYFFGISLKSPYFLVLFPRIVMTLLSFISDYCLFKICTIFHEPFVDRMNIFASSYIMLTYCTRTFSNSIEMILSSMLIYYVSRCIEFSSKVVLQSDYLAEKYYKAKNGVERTRIHKLRVLLPSHSLNDCLHLAALAVVGIFNRPTFIAFALPPIFFWLQRGLGSKSVGFLDFHIRIFMLVLCAVPIILFLTIYDSFYFGYLTSEEVGKLEITINSFVVTPFNFLKYNTLTDNLKQHGLHPRFLHILVNVPLLFNVLGIFGIYEFAKMVNSGMKGKWLELPRIQSIDSLMIASFIVPIALLSIFPHQEPRFIIPVFLPLVFLFAHCIKSPDIDVINIPDRKKSASVTPQKKDYINYKKIWYISNIILAIFYGFIHQGGILPLSSYLFKELKSKPDLTHIHLYISYSYPLPTGLLHLRNTKRTYISNSGHKYKLVKDFYMNEFGSEGMEFVHNKIALDVYDRERYHQFEKIPSRLYYALPYSLYNEFLHYTLNNETQFFNTKFIKSFYPHFSLEKPPELHFIANCSIVGLPQCVLKFVKSPMDNVINFFRQFSLVLLRIEPVSKKRL
ncbi:GPI mannosyltransferase 4 isoform X2 [Phymastichus coffea]|uniref:GPI mannosyltransferase 4 isoform X2 n=1 Tax=Phymastichus coffea TaxID=108790 RepID=UPI00273B528C|nr:GPI mannosyltransferase 4 isoform X2 [Phymastichus coffea]